MTRRKWTGIDIGGPGSDPNDTHARALPSFGSELSETPGARGRGFRQVPPREVTRASLAQEIRLHPALGRIRLDLEAFQPEGGRREEGLKLIWEGLS